MKKKITLSDLKALESNLTGGAKALVRERGYNSIGINAGGGSTEIKGTKMDSNDRCECIPTNSICPDGCKFYAQ